MSTLVSELAPPDDPEPPDEPLPESPSPLTEPEMTPVDDAGPAATSEAVDAAPEMTLADDASADGYQQPVDNSELDG